MKKEITVVLFVVVFLSACSKHQLFKSDVQESLKLPTVGQNCYTSSEVLDSLYHLDEENVINYRLARLLASAELLAGLNEVLTDYSDEAWHLTPCPRVVYGYDNMPKYYEFGYVVGESVVATITTFAKRENSGVVAFIFDTPLEYPYLNMDYYIGNYPSRYYGANGTCYLDNCGQEVMLRGMDTLSDEDVYDELLELMPEEDRQIINDSSEQIQQTQNDETSMKNVYWGKVDLYLDTLSDDSIFLKPIRDITTRNLGYYLLYPDYDVYHIAELIELFDYSNLGGISNILSEYDNANLLVTEWGGYCGPSACAWIYRGKYNSFDGYQLHLYGDGNTTFFDEIIDCSYAKYDYSLCTIGLNLTTTKERYRDRSDSADNGLSWIFYDECVPFYYGGEWTFPLYHGGLNRGFINATNGDYGVVFTVYPTDWIRINNQPVIIAKGTHYVAAVGVNLLENEDGDVIRKMYLVKDNGFTTSGNNHRPYWTAYNCWNLHYGLKYLQ